MDDFLKHGPCQRPARDPSMEKLLSLLRAIAPAPLLAMGIQHRVGSAPMKPILEDAGLPSPELTAQVAPLLEVVAALSMLLGFMGRFRALVGGRLAEEDGPRAKP